MSKGQLRRSLKRAAWHPKGRFHGICRYIIWQFWRKIPKYPKRARLTERTVLQVDRKSEINGPFALSYFVGPYDYNNMNFLRQVLDDDQESTCFIDVGANVGTYTLFLSETPEVQVYAFEPHPETCRQLRRNVDHNERTNVIIEELGLSDHAGAVSFSDEPGSPVNRIVEGAGDEAGEKTCSIRIIRGDEYFSEQVAAQLVVKIDVEGHELAVLRGLEGVLGRCGIIFLEENHDRKLVRALLPPEFIGPLYVDFDRREIRDVPNNQFEDALWLNTEIVPRLEKRLGYRICPAGEGSAGGEGRRNPG